MNSKEEEAERLRQAILQKFTGTKVSASDRNMYLAGAKFGYDYRDKSVWIEVAAKTPPLGITILCWSETGGFSMRYFSLTHEGQDATVFIQKYNVTHWQLPNPPQP